MIDPTSTPDVERALQTVLDCCHMLCADEAPASELATWLGTIDPARSNRGKVIVVPSDRIWKSAELSRERDGTVSLLRLVPADGIAIPFAALEATFGEGDEMTRIHFNAPKALVFDHAERGFACKVVGELFEDLPKDTPRRVAAITLRRDGRVV